MITDIKNIWHTPYKRFVLLGTIFYLLWDFLLYPFVNSFLFLREDLTWLITVHSSYFLQVIHADVSYVGQVLHIGESSVLKVIPVCNAINFFGVLLCFVFAFPRPILHKVLFLPVGFVVIYVLNIIRIASLTLIQFYYPSVFPFAHSWGFVALIYGLTLGLCFLWVNISERRGLSE